MPGWIESIFAFFFKYRPAVFAKGDLAFGAPSSVILLLLGALIIGIIPVLSYTAVRARSTRRDRWVLGGLRVASLLVLMACLFRPMLLLSAAVPQRNFVGVLLDDSRSMSIQDANGKPRGDFIAQAFGSSDSTLLKQLQKKFQVRLFRFGGSLDRIDSTRALTYTDHETHVGDAVERATQELESVPLSGLVLVTDGADNSGQPIEDQLLNLRAHSVPVFAIGVGNEHLDRDIEIQRVEVPHTVLKGAAITADLLVRQRGFAGKRVPLVIQDGSRIVSQDTIDLPADGDVAPVHVDVSMKESGPRQLTFTVPVQPGEAVEKNNSQVALVDVREDREKVLYVEGEPRTEVRFVRAAVAADTNLQLVVLQRTAESPPKFLRLNVSDPKELMHQVGDSVVPGFPITRSELFRYKAIIIGSVQASFFTREQLQMLTEFVSLRGGGMLFLGGRRAFSEGGYQGTSLADVMPVFTDGPVTADSMTFFSELRVSLTPEGRNHSVTQVASAPEKSAARWAKVPVVTSTNYIARVKPGAVTLLEGRATTDTSGWPQGKKIPDYSQPILVYQHFGRGLSVAMPIQDSYLWQMDPNASIDDVMYQSFWRQMLRWLTADVPGKISVTATPDQVEPKSPITIHATVVDSIYHPRNDAQVVAHIRHGADTTQDLPLQWVVDRDGEYQASFTPADTGRYSIRVDVAKATGDTTAVAAEDSVMIRAANLNAEYVDAEMNASLLKRIADETGGKFYTPATSKSLAEDVAMSKRGVTVVNQMDLWDMPINFLLLLCLVSAEWAYRKARGLA